MEAEHAIPHYEVTAGIVWDRDPSAEEARVLITKRRSDDAHGGLWEFPGGKQESGESLKECLARELAEELGIEVAVQEPFIAVEHDYSDFRITLHTFHCQIVSGKPKTIACEDFQWVTVNKLSKYCFSAADQQLVAKLQKADRQTD
jgi:mutator protein MutT